MTHTPNTPIDYLHCGTWHPARYLRSRRTQNGVIHNVVLDGRLKIAFSDDAIREAQLPEAPPIPGDLLHQDAPVAFDWERLERLIQGETITPASTHPAKSPLESPSRRENAVSTQKQPRNTPRGKKRAPEEVFDDALPF